MNYRKIRSVLYVPGDNEKALKKASMLPCDAVMFDLEDSIADEKKELARILVKQGINDYDYGSRTLIVRINRLDSPWGEEDIRSLTGTDINAICIPKVESAKELELIRSKLAKQSNERIPIWAMIETPKGIIDVVDIASAQGLGAIVVGTTDLSHRLRLRNASGGNRAGLYYSLSRCVLAARLIGIEIFDGVFLDFSDKESFIAQCEDAKNLGFDGKTLIHPAQIEITNKVFGASSEEVERARKIISAWEEATAMGKAVAVVDNQLIELMHIEEAKQIVESHS